MTIYERIKPNDINKYEYEKFLSNDKELAREYAFNISVYNKNKAEVILEDFDRWIEGAYFYMISDFIVAVTLAETDIAFTVADNWIDSGEDLKMSAGWSCYNWLLGTRKDSEFDKDKLLSMLKRVRDTIHNQPERTKYAMNEFIMSVGISYLPLHEEAMKIAQEVGKVDVLMGKKVCQTNVAAEYIQNAVDKGRLGFKRKHVRC
jgi:hypothetical protein